jgi:hypothetical protein
MMIMQENYGLHFRKVYKISNNKYANLKITSQNFVSTQIALCTVKTNYSHTTRGGETEIPRETKTCHMTRAAYAGVLP